MKPSETQSMQIQILRGLAIIAVVLTHTLPTPGFSHVLFRPFINFAVGLFLFLSGCLTPLERFYPTKADSNHGKSMASNIFAFYRKRLGRVIPPYLLWSLVYTVYHGRYADFLPRLLTGRCCGIYYFIIVYVQLTLLTPLLCFVIKKAPPAMFTPGTATTAATRPCPSGWAVWRPSCASPPPPFWRSMCWRGGTST